MIRFDSWLLCLALCCAGCGPNAGGAGESKPKPTTETKPAEVAIDFKTWPEAEKIIAGHKGKIVVVDVWSTVCLPCMEKFPGLVALQKKYPDDVVCMSFNVDDNVPTSKERQERILTFLNKQNATFQNLVVSNGSDAFYEASKTFSIPLIFVYDRQGNRVEMFKDDTKKYGKAGFNYEQHVTPAVEKLLTTAAPVDTGK